MTETSRARRVPTAILTGFLGVGKTTALRYLLKHKPANEFWAVVLNEFGEVNIDVELIAKSNDGIAVREIPGGCICCVTAPVLRVGIQRLLQAKWPDRLLIEPTGLGHPARIVSMLRDPWMSRSVQLKSVLCIVDAREFAQEKFRDHPIYAEQLRAASAIVVNKSDVATDAEREYAARYLAIGQPAKPILGYVTQGEISPEWLDLGEDEVAGLPAMENASLMHSRSREMPAAPAETPLGAGEFIRGQRTAEGYVSNAWIFSAATIFSQSSIQQLVGKLGDVEWLGACAVRAKLLVRVAEAQWLSISWRAGEWRSEMLTSARDSRVEVVIESEAAWPREAAFERELCAAALQSGKADQYS